MFRDERTYTDYNGNERIAETFFNLDEDELLEIEFSIEGGLEACINKYVEENNNAGIFQLIKRFILASYGKKSEDGQTFVKSEEATKEFSQSAVYKSLISELIKDADKAAAFLNGIIATAKKNDNVVPMNK